MSHGIAWLTVHGRRLIVQRHEAGWPKAHIAAAIGVSRKCVTTWINRFAIEGEAGLPMGSSHPQSMPRRPIGQVEARVLAERTRRRQGHDALGPRIGVRPQAISRILRPSPSAVSAQAGLDNRVGDPSLQKTAIRYERARPGELVHMDVNKLRAPFSK